MSNSRAFRFVPRRRTLLAAIGTSAAAAAVLLTKREQLAQELALPDKEESAPESVGYHETEHIRKYYRSVGF
ncbi:hypothetical protein GCM10027343_03110 [Noviherbaspirillum agri]